MPHTNTDAESKLMETTLARDEASSSTETRPGDLTNEESPLLGKANRHARISRSRTSPTLVVGITFAGVFLGALDKTVLATLAAPIATSFGSFSSISWVASTYLIANAACQPLLGRLTDIYGRRSGLIVSNVLFAVGNLICGLAPNGGIMILGRAISGLGGGGMMAISNFIASDLVPLRQRGMVQGMSNLVFGTACGLGGLFGGLINDTLGWRAAFLIQVPLSLLSTALVYGFVINSSKPTKKSKVSRIDFSGAFTLTGALITLLLGLNLGGGSLGFKQPLVLGCFAISLLAICLFIWVELKWAEEPILPVDLMLTRTVAMANLNIWFTLMVVFAVLFYIPIWLQVRGLSTTEAGLYLIPYSVGISSGSLLAGYVMQRTGRYVALGNALMTFFVLGSSLLLVFNLSSPLWLAEVSLPMIGFGYGGVITVNLLANIASLGHEHQAVITSSNYVFRSTGSTIGVTVASVVWQHTVRADIQKLSGHNNDLARKLWEIVDRLHDIHHLPADLQQFALQSSMHGLHAVFITCLVIATTAFLCQIFVKQHKLHSELARE